MLNRRAIIVLGAFIFALTILGSFKVASAAVVLNQTTSDGDLIPGCVVGGGSHMCWNSPTTTIASPDATTIAGWPVAHRFILPTSSYISALQIKMKKLGNSAGAIHVLLRCTATNVFSNESFTPNSLTSDYQTYTFTFPIPNACDFSSTGTYVSAVGFDTDPAGLIAVAGTDTPNATYPYLGVGLDGSYDNPDLSYQPYLIMADQGGLPIGSGGATQATPSNPIIWQNPPFSQNFKQNGDFLNWANCIYLDASSTQSVVNDGYFLKISYGTSTNWTMNDYSLMADQGQATTTQGYGQIYQLPTNLCSQTPKYNLPTNLGLNASTTFISQLPPGNYLAQAGLYETNFSSAPRFIASSSVLSFTLLGSGAWTELPAAGGTGGSINLCTPTSFSVFSVDYGKGLCSVAVYLFYPSDAALSSFSGLWDTIKPKPPFGWFTVAQDTLGGISTSTAPTTTLMSLSLISVFVSPIDYALAFLVLVAFVFFLWHRFRKFNFHQ